ncbi:hypothetical protein PV326_000984 [Microctonus aethiopoides]|nr:hypothetical protein PV326_000984 [Microctonus aethiopoides]
MCNLDLNFGIMEVVLETGFEKILHSIEFQPQTVQKGRLLNEVSHVINVKEFRRNGTNCRIEARVIRQTSVNSTSYTIKLILDYYRNIISVSCTCVYNKSGKCKHIAAVIYYINNDQSLSKTNFEQQWGAPSVTQVAKEMYCKGQYVFQMYPPNKKPNIQPIKTTIDELPEPSPYRTMLLEAAKGNDYYSSKAKIASVQKHQMIENEKIDCQLIIENFFYFKENYDVYCSGSSVGSNCEEYYEKNIILTKCDILKLSSDTLKQSKCDKWYQARNIRLSSSKNIHVI